MGIEVFRPIISALPVLSDLMSTRVFGPTILGLLPLFVVMGISDNDSARVF